MADLAADVEVGIDPAVEGAEATAVVVEAAPEPAPEPVEAEQASESEAPAAPDNEPSVETLGEMETYTPERFPNIPAQICETSEWELKGSYPNVPFASGVDYDALTEGDDKPFFITLPLVTVGAVSANKLRYTQEFCQSLVDQINSDKPSGIRGHIKEEDRRTAYPNPEIFWVGASLESGKVWAKGYIPAGATREEYRIKKAVNAKAATSIYGKPLLITEYKDGTYTPVLSLEQVDLAPPKRAALGMGHDFAVTREMAQDTTSPTEEPVDRAQIIAELTVADIPQTVRAAIISEYEQAENIAEMRQRASVVGELFTMLGEDANVVEVVRQMHGRLTELSNTLGVEGAEVVVRVNEMHSRVQEMAQRELDAAVDGAIAELTAWNAASDAAKERLTSLRTLLRGGVIGALNGEHDPATVKEIAERVFEQNRPIAEAVRDVLAGPPAFVPGRVESPNQPQLPTDADIEAARARTGISI